MSRTRWPVLLLVPWSVYVWVTRIVNALGDEAADATFSVALSLSVLVPTVAVGVVLVQARRRPLTEVEGRLLQAVAGWTGLVWLARGVEISLSDHTVAFKVVHVVIGIVSIGLAVATVRVARRELATPRPTGVPPRVGADR